MAYTITLVIGGVVTPVSAPAESASVSTITEGLDSLDCHVAWSLNTLRDDTAYDAIKYVWPGALARLQLHREDTMALVFDGQVHAVAADRGEDRFTIRAQS